LSNQNVAYCFVEGSRVAAAPMLIVVDPRWQSWTARPASR
jgi:hypothetical protein